MGEVALSRIEYGRKASYDRDRGTWTETDGPSYVEAGQPLPSKGFTKEQKDELRRSGSLGDESLLRTTAQSTPAVLQSPETAQLLAADAEANAARAVIPGTPATEDEIAKAHRLRTDETLRDDEGLADVEAVEKAEATEEKGAEKAAKADEKAADK